MSLNFTQLPLSSKNCQKNMVKDKKQTADIIYKVKKKGAVVMRIDATNRIYNSYNAQASAATRIVEKTTSKDEVALSGQAKDFAAVKKMLEGVPEVRAERVKEVKEKMDSDNYNVSAHDVARKILSQNNFRG